MLNAIERDGGVAKSKRGVSLKRFSSRTFAVFVRLTCLLAAIYPIFRMVFFLSSVGENNPSNDDLMIVPLLGKILDGSYPWSHFLHDTFLNGHQQSFPVLFHVLLARFAHWDLRLALDVGIALGVLRWLLLFDILAYRVEGVKKWLLLPLLSALVFSPSQLSSYEFEFATLTNGLTLLGLLLGIGGLLKNPGKWSGVAWMLCGGILAGGSSGFGILVWPVFAIAMFFFGFRKKTQYAVWLLGMAVSALPYAYYLFLHPAHDLYALVEQRSADYALMKSVFRFPLIVRSVGWPFAQNFSLETARERGAVGLVFLAVAVVLLYRKRKDPEFVFRAAPAILLIVYGLLAIYQVSVFRNLLAPWYSVPFMIFWVGMAGLAFSFWGAWKPKDVFAEMVLKVNFFILPFWSLAFLWTVSYFYFTSNLTFEDKSVFLKSRAPVSRSCLMNYRTAPTYCEQALFQWVPGQFHLLAELAEPLERNQLSVFGPRRRMALQGDILLGTVRIHENQGIPPVFWSADSSNQFAPYNDYHRLNLFLHAPNSVDWKIRLPKNLATAKFQSATAISPAAPRDPASDGVVFRLGVREEGGAETELFSQKVPPGERSWKPFEVDLSRYAGKTVTLRLFSDPVGNVLHDWLLLRHPVVDVWLREGKGENIEAESGQKPSNTDLAESPSTPSAQDFFLGPFLSEKESFTVFPAEGDDKERSFLKYSGELNANLGAYSHFYLKAALSEDVYPRAVGVSLLFGGDASERKSFLIPLLADGKLHGYTYDLRLLGLQPGGVLRGLILEPGLKAEGIRGRKIKIERIGFLRD